MESQARKFLSALENQQVFSANTCLGYAGDLRKFITHLHDVLGHPPTLADFTSQKISSFLEAEQQKGLGAATIRRRLATLRRFASFLGKDILITTTANPTIATRTEKSLDPTSILTDQDIQRLIHFETDNKRPQTYRNFAIFMVILETGLSVDQLVKLNFTDSAPDKIQIGHLKNRWISPDQSRLALEKYLQIGRPELNCLPGETALFISQKGSRITRQAVWQNLSQFGKDAKISCALSARKIRNTAVFQMRKNGIPIDEIQYRLGHRYPQSTKILLKQIGRIDEHGITPDKMKE